MVQLPSIMSVTASASRFSSRLPSTSPATPCNRGSSMQSSRTHSGVRPVSSSISYRPALPKDAYRILALKDAYLDELPTGARRTSSQIKHYVHDYTSAIYTHVWVAERAGKIFGVVEWSGGPTRTEAHNCGKSKACIGARIQALVIDSAHQRRGHGRGLMLEALAKIGPHCRVKVVAKGSVVGFYQTLGFRKPRRP